jgi:transposase
MRPAKWSYAISLRRQVLAFFQKLPRRLVGIEACASSHHWSHQLQALGHAVRLMPPAYVKPYVKRQKNDATDAEAICEAVTRPNSVSMHAAIGRRVVRASSHCERECLGKFAGVP